MSAKPIQTSDLIFPILSTDFSSTLSSLKRSTLSISNRLRSIASDADFVCSVADAYGLPLVANERCGSWYIPLERKSASAYFKSTDGHTGEWSFSLRRLNTQVLEAIGKTDGCVIVDSTRRGKRMPDALSKTVPIWCAVWNRLLFPDVTAAQELHTPPQSVSRSEHSQIEYRLDNFVKQARQDLNLDLPELRSRISKPLRPLWVTQESGLPEDQPSFPDFHPVVLCTSSRRVPGGEASEGGYIQGAGDDSEGWARGLTAPSFWENKSRLLETQEGDLPELIAELLASSGSKSNTANTVLIKPTDWLFVCPLETLHGVAVDEYDTVISCADKPDGRLLEVKKSKYLHLNCGTGKLGSRDLRSELVKIETFVQTLPPSSTLAVGCQTGKDISIGVVLAILCLYVNDSGKFTSPKGSIDKNFIRQRLSWIMTSFPAASPSRATLQSVNAFLFSPRTHAPSLAPKPNIPAPAATDTSSALANPHDTTKPKPPSKPQDQSPMTLESIFNSLSTSPPSTPWKLTRKLTSALPTMPSGTFNGHATFTPRAATATPFTAEYLYSEEGTLQTDTGLVMIAQRKYIWRYRRAAAGNADDDGSSVAREGISVWFAGEDGESANGLFVEMEFAGDGEAGGKEKTMCAKGHHWCEPDDYKARFEFREDGFKVVYVVRGPKKDYVSSTEYSRT
ncbi:uncharacterized protein K452DRAFT_269293 [Aplosporella prunicola CBS 121167]|uniref:tRNA A64-2'-O-ribosylphosphate transferase n=1 Tax=Aplosporella prunicola CBS 121167 TaxID=1176127 RepID=A0A6A6BFH9_9PEZI|nr:uncharacterized protein K452DRAFT_269293 [Aplosporella prunicola CBS 121167]KAF2142816.1 hypothetical protein K452DRAFT_269293 [Aplosporella prunicola CBS 121167]